MFLVFAAARDPLFDQRDFVRAKRFVLGGGWHHVVIGGGDAPDQFRRVGVAFDDDGLSRVAVFVSEFCAIEAQRFFFGLARRGIRAVTLKTMFGEKRPDLVVVGNGVSGRRGRGANETSAASKGARTRILLRRGPFIFSSDVLQNDVTFAPVIDA